MKSAPFLLLLVATGFGLTLKHPSTKDDITSLIEDCGNSYLCKRKKERKNFIIIQLKKSRYLKI
jgi:hypothetical protein